MEQVKGNDAVCGSALEMMTDGVGDCFTLNHVPFGQASTISLWAFLHSDEAGVRITTLQSFGINCSFAGSV